ncbi:hypothetical protein FN846DRAFT_886262 [Sphaerosporella brunnea]|uniref:Uncharacterized protein n=1 Tax=Sphaerosporella brunnea TaxID=1250544 RepID=A0A5J5FAC4_9PEZI|nr:hypothetical protein FN846DRAFT_886262 [Sphaerosporella brunnea]
MAASLNPPPTPPGTSTGHSTSPASNILLRLPGELHLQISSYPDEDLVSMALAVASDNCTSYILLPYYIPRLSDEKRRLLTIALLTGFPITSLCWILDVLVFGIETEHVEVLHRSDMYTYDEEYWREQRLASWRPSAHRVGILKAAAALSKVGVLQALFGRITSFIDMAALAQGVLTRYPTAIHYACPYAQPDAVRWVTDWYSQQAPAALHVVFSDNQWLRPAFWRCTPFCVAVTGFRFPGRTQQNVLRVLEILERYPAVGVVPSEGDVHWLERLDEELVRLPAMILRVLMRRMPFGADQGIKDIISSLAIGPTPISLGYMQVLLLEAGMQLKKECWVNFVMSGNTQLFSWMPENVTGFLPTVPERWSTLRDTLAVAQFPISNGGVGEHIPPTNPAGFAGDQRLCFAILTSEGVTATPTEFEEGAPTPPEYFRPFVDALVRAGADLDCMWVDREPRKNRRDTPRMTSYRNWTACQLLEKIQRTGRL